MSYNYNTNMFEGYIYMITNELNNKQYIGQTTTTLENRLMGHVRKSKAKQNNTQFFKDLERYGIDNFSIKEIEKITSPNKTDLKKLLNEKEIYYIEKYKTLLKYGGYNTSIGGGSGSFNSKVVYCFSENGEFLKEFKSFNEAAQFVGCCQSNIGAAIKNKRLCYGYYFNTKKVYDCDKWKYFSEYPVFVYDKFGKYLGKCKSCIDAAEKYNITKEQVYYVCIGKYSSSHGYTFSYYYDSFNSVKLKRGRQINLYKGDKFISTHPTILSAAESIGACASNIGMMANKKIKTIFGYTAYYAEDPSQPDKSKIIDKSLLSTH